jgi:hypothetical protein
MNWAIDGGTEDAVRSAGVAFCVSERLGNGCADLTLMPGACVFYEVRSGGGFLSIRSTICPVPGTRPTVSFFGTFWLPLPT